MLSEHYKRRETVTHVKDSLQLDVFEFCKSIQNIKFDIDYDDTITLLYAICSIGVLAKKQDKMSQELDYIMTSVILNLISKRNKNFTQSQKN